MGVLSGAWGAVVSKLRRGRDDVWLAFVIRIRHVANLRTRRRAVAARRVLPGVGRPSPKQLAFSGRDVRARSMVLRLGALGSNACHRSLDLPHEPSTQRARRLPPSPARRKARRRRLAGWPRRPSPVARGRGSCRGFHGHPDPRSRISDIHRRRRMGKCTSCVGFLCDVHCKNRSGVQASATPAQSSVVCRVCRSHFYDMKFEIILLTFRCVLQHPLSPEPRLSRRRRGRRVHRSRVPARAPVRSGPRVVPRVRSGPVAREPRAVRRRRARKTKQPTTTGASLGTSLFDERAPSNHTTVPRK